MSERKRTRYGFTDVELADNWNASDSTQEVAEKLTQLCRQKGTISNEVTVPRSVVLARAATYKKAGVQLKQLKRAPRRKLDVNALNQHIQAQEQAQP